LAVDIINGNVLVPDSMNPYLYVLNNPLRYFDPDGREKVIVNGEVQDWFVLEKNGNKYINIQNLMSAYSLNPQFSGNTGGIKITANGSRNSPRDIIEKWNFSIGLNTSGFDAHAVFYRVGATKKDSYNLGDHMAGLMVDYDYFRKILCSYDIKADIMLYEDIVKEMRVTPKMMSDFGWSISILELIKLNNVLEKYGITDMNSIRLFLATCAQESGKGFRSLERLNLDGSTVGEYSVEERGAGYIQLTWRKAHLDFLKSVDDPFDEIDTANYISINYPWEATAWFWSSEEAKNTTDGSLNNYSAKYGDSKGVFLITQYYTNSWADGLTKEIASDIRDGKVQWEIAGNKLYVNGQEIANAPRDWEDREDAYNEAISFIK
jgi:hypothetical protein